MFVKRDAVSVCKVELFCSQEQPQSLRTPPPADYKALKQKSLCVQTKNISTNVYLPERHYSSSEEHIQTGGELAQLAESFVNIYPIYKKK